MIIVFLFSFVWYWNETFVTGLYTRSTPTIPLRIQQFKASYEAMFPPGTPGSELNEAIKLAGHLIGILPLLILYFVMQKHFTESIDRTGIAGE
jgi:multiple sugar transport system permease protein